MKSHVLSNLRALEAESVFIFREVAAEMARPCLLFSGGKDSTVMLAIARKAFAPAPIPFPIMHVDTGLNFPEVIAYRDRWVKELGLKLIVASVPEAIERGLVQQEPNGSPNRIQTPVLLEAVEQNGFDCLFGGARRDEEKARAKERVFSFRDEFGQWDPKNQRPELWSLYNGRVHQGQTSASSRSRTGPSSTSGRTSTPRRSRSAPLYFAARARGVHAATGCCTWSTSSRRRSTARRPSARRALPDDRRREPDRRRRVRRRHAREDVAEIAAVRITERGATRGDDQRQRSRHGRPQARGLLLMATAPAKACRAREGSHAAAAARKVPRRPRRPARACARATSSGSPPRARSTTASRR